MTKNTDFNELLHCQADLQAAKQADELKKQDPTVEGIKAILLTWRNKPPFWMDALGRALEEGDWKQFDLSDGAFGFLHEVGTSIPLEQRAYFQQDSPIWQEPMRSELCRHFVCVKRVYGCDGPQYEFYESLAEAALHRRVVPQPGEELEQISCERMLSRKEQLERDIEFLEQHPELQQPAGIMDRLRTRLNYTAYGYPQF